MSWWMEDHGDMEDSVDYGIRNFWTNKTKTKKNLSLLQNFFNKAKNHKPNDTVEG